MTAIHQFIPTLAPRDAVGTHTIALRDALRGAGYRSDIYALEAKDAFKHEARDFQSFRADRAGEPTWLMYQLSIGSPVADFVLERPEPLIVNYHNITPAEFFAGWEPIVARRLRLGRRQLRALADRASLGIAVSAFNERELVEEGFRRTAVAPVIINAIDISAAPDPALSQRLRAVRAPGGGAHLLFVGRLAPNKAQHDVVKAFSVYRQVYDPNARCTLVGDRSSDSYQNALRAFVHELGLDDRVTFAGSVSDGELAAYYTDADAFVVMSEHEGFCVPLLEAMARGLPIVAFGSGGVAETIGDAGLVLTRKDPCTVAAAIDRLVNDPLLRARLAQAAGARLAHYSPDRSRAALVDAVAACVGVAGSGATREQ